MGNRRVSRKVSFWDRVDRRGQGECWPWLYGKTTAGYGSVTIAHRKMLAHRVAYELSVGPIPDGNYICHHCDNPPCCNPDHLFVGTAQTNNDDAMAKGRGPSQALRKYWATLSAEERLPKWIGWREGNDRFWASMTPEERSAHVQNGRWAGHMVPKKLTREEANERRGNFLRTYQASLTPEQRSARMKTAWATRRKNNR